MIIVTALGAGAAMYAQNIVATLMVQAEARNRAVLAGLTECVQYGLQLAASYLALNALFTGTFAEQAWIIGAVSVANFFGTYTGVRLGARFIGREEDTQ